jgi:hypothetical protein
VGIGWTTEELWRKLDEFETVLTEAQLKRSSVRTYVDRTKFFLRWLDGDYEPRGPQGT